MKDSQGAFMPDIDMEIAGADDGPLKGRTFAVKDVYDVAGYPTSNGHPLWRDTHGTAKTTAPAVQAMLDAGATLVGKTICDELCYSLTGENRNYGTPKNAKSPDRLPGGSSAGSAAATGAGLVDFALGGDTGGSIRVPASFNGVFGMRNSYGRVDPRGVCPLAPSYDTAGWLASDMELYAEIGKILLKNYKEPGDVTKLLVAEDMFEKLTDEEKAAVRPKVDLVEAAAGMKAEAVTLGDDSIGDWQDIFRHLQGWDIHNTVGPWVKEHNPDFEPGVKQRMEFVMSLTEEDVAPFKAMREQITKRVQDIIGEAGTVLVLPTAGSAPHVGAELDELNAFRVAAMGLTCPAGHANVPQLSMPLAEAGGAALGLSIMAWRNQDELLLELGRKVAKEAGL